MKSRNLSSAIFAITLMVFILIYPKACIDAVKTAIQSCMFVVFPSLFPFMVATTLLVKSNLLSIFAKGNSRIARRLFGCSGHVFYIYLSSILGGYPLGAKLACELYAQAQISKEECIKITNMTSTSGPIFIQSVVCVSVLGTTRMFLELYLAHILSALIAGWILQQFVYPDGIKKNSGSHRRQSHAVSMTGFTDRFIFSVQSALKTMLMVCGLIIFFSVLTEFLSQSGLLDQCSRFFQYLLHSQTAGAALAKGALEMSNGILSLQPGIENLNDMALSALIILTFGGLCIMMQTKAILGEQKIKNKYFLIAKAIQTGCAVGLFMLFAGLGGSTHTAVFYAESTEMYSAVFSYRILLLLSAVLSGTAIFDIFIHTRRNKSGQIRIKGNQFTHKGG